MGLQKICIRLFIEPQQITRRQFVKAPNFVTNRIGDSFCELCKLFTQLWNIWKKVICFIKLSDKPDKQITSFWETIKNNASMILTILLIGMVKIFSYVWYRLIPVGVNLPKNPGSSLVLPSPRDSLPYLSSATSQPSGFNQQLWWGFLKGKMMIRW